MGITVALALSFSLAECPKPAWFAAARSAETAGLGKWDLDECLDARDELGCTALVVAATANPDVLIGYGANTMEYWTGDLDEAAMWTAVLSASDIRSMYTYGIGTGQR